MRINFGLDFICLSMLHSTWRRTDRSLQRPGLRASAIMPDISIPPCARGALQRRLQEHGSSPSGPPRSVPSFRNASVIPDGESEPGSLPMGPARVPPEGRLRERANGLVAHGRDHRSAGGTLKESQPHSDAFGLKGDRRRQFRPAAACLDAGFQSSPPLGSHLRTLEPPGTGRPRIAPEGVMLSRMSLQSRGPMSTAASDGRICRGRCPEQRRR